MMSDAPWRDEVLALATRYYDDGHAAENRAVELGRTGPQASEYEAWAEAGCYRDIYGELCALVARLDPRPGAPSAPARPW